MVEPDVTVIIPVFNDLHSLDIAIPRTIEILSRIPEGFELIIAEDGSTDGSTERVRSTKQMITAFTCSIAMNVLGGEKHSTGRFIGQKEKSYVILTLILQLTCNISPS